ncbi:MAG: gliding motility protein GldL [Saprospiraceae bacterium]|nr:gliding motility protein GldL [Saprospiraceae bacterium]
MFWKSKGFKYVINFLFGLGAAVVMLGALAKLNHTDIAGIPGDFLIALGLGIEAGLFLIQGLIPPTPDYYWEKLYPGLDGTGEVAGGPAIASFQDAGSGISAQLDEVLDNANVNRLSVERLGQNLERLSDNIDKMNQISDIGAANARFVEKADGAMGALDAVQESMGTLKGSVAALNQKYVDMLEAMKS